MEYGYTMAGAAGLDPPIGQPRNPAQSRETEVSSALARTEQNLDIFAKLIDTLEHRISAVLAPESQNEADSRIPTTPNTTEMGGRLYEYNRNLEYLMQKVDRITARVEL